MGVLPYGSGARGRCEATVDECECVCGTCDSYLHACHVALAVVKGAWPGQQQQQQPPPVVFVISVCLFVFFYTHTLVYPVQSRGISKVLFLFCCLV